tara:strand:+ start:336 stop:581 length:246 start_codon:yes stop_codon:yes gene_type:complete
MSHWRDLWSYGELDANPARLGTKPPIAIVQAAPIPLAIGAHQCIRSHLYNNRMTFWPGVPVLDHRKLVPREAAKDRKLTAR